jgi:hypothetical protein
LLFDDEADPWQLQNLVDQPDRVQDAELRLDSLLAEAADPAHGAEDTLRELDLVALWNQRETELNGQSARTLMEI